MYEIRNYTILSMGLQLGPTHYGKNIDLRMFENSAKMRMFEKDEGSNRVWEETALEGAL